MTPVNAFMASLCSLVVAVTCPSPVARWWYCAAFIVCLCAILRTSWPAKVVLLWILPFAIPLFAIHGLINKNFPADAYFINTIPYRTSGLDFAATIASSMLIFLVSATAWLTVRRDAIVDAIFSLRMPLWVAVIGSQSVGMIEHVRRNVGRVYLAQRARGIPVASNAWSRVRAFPSILIPVIVSVLLEAEGRGAALASRGFGSARPVAATNLSATTGDFKSTLAFLACVALGMGIQFWR